MQVIFLQILQVIIISTNANNIFVGKLFDALSNEICKKESEYQSDKGASNGTKITSIF